MEKKHLIFYQRRIDQNHHHGRNILHIKGDTRKTTKGVPRCYGYHETCWWNSRWCPCQRLCSLQKIDQGAIQQQTFYSPIKGNKVTHPACQSLKYCWDR